MKNNKILMTIALLAMAGSAQPASTGPQSSDVKRGEESLEVLKAGAESHSVHTSGGSSFLPKVWPSLKARLKSEQGKARTYFSARDVVENYEALKKNKQENQWLGTTVQSGDYQGRTNAQALDSEGEIARLEKLRQELGLEPNSTRGEVETALLAREKSQQDSLKVDATEEGWAAKRAYKDANFNPANIDFKESVLDKIRYNPGAVRFGRGLSAAGRVANVANFAREAITGRNAILELLALNKTLRGNALFNKLLTGKKGARALRFLISSIQALLLDQAFAAPVAGKRGVLSALFRRGSDEEDDLDVVKTAANSVADVHSADGVSL